jgi:hypothetical protein
MLAVVRPGGGRTAAGVGSGGGAPLITLVMDATRFVGIEGERVERSWWRRA